MDGSSVLCTVPALYDSRQSFHYWLALLVGNHKVASPDQLVKLDSFRIRSRFGPL